MVVFLEFLFEGLENGLRDAGRADAVEFSGAGVDDRVGTFLWWGRTFGWGG